MIEAENAEVALRVLSGDEKIDLLFTDVVMPGAMDGYELANFATRLRFSPEVLLTSGFPAIRSPDKRANQTEYPLAWQTGTASTTWRMRYVLHWIAAANVPAVRMKPARVIMAIDAAS